ncbi:MAG: substrate-binding component of ABC transporter [Chloroflexi bacterium]|nr:MAG: substrate-binding component of ABC transporter [Chloroflexota bacterium]MBA4376250.1 ABC transporter substrate-binding protein [Anaerolinea sp.]
MKKSMLLVVSVIVVFAMLLAACKPAAPTAAPVEPEAPVATEAPVVPDAPKNQGLQMDAAKVAPQFYNDADFDESLQLMKQAPLNPDAPIYMQYLINDPVDTTQYKKAPPYNICFSNAGVNNPWRVVGYTTMREQVEELRAAGLIKNFIHVDAQGQDAKQIADIEDLIATPGKCDLLIVSPNTSEALTPAVEKACEKLPVVVFDRGVLTDCPVVFEKTIGGYAFGISGAQFIVDNLPEGGNVLAFRILPGVDVLEQRWGAAKRIFEEAGNINVVGVEFDDYNTVKTNTIVRDYIDRFGHIDGIWMDAGGPAVGALEAYQDLGLPFPVMVGEDQNDYLKFWKENNLTAIAPTFPTFQWRSAVLIAVKILQGETVQHRWVLPQPDVTQENLDKYYNAAMPPLYYALSGAEDMKNWPDAWINVDTTKYVDVLP